MILEEMYPVGSRVQLDYMGPDPYSKLKPGDLGTVMMLDDAGGLHVSWDCGSSLALIYKEDFFTCVMKNEQMETIFLYVTVMPFESIEKLRVWLEEKLKPAFPEMGFDKDTKGELEVGLHVNAFQMKNNKIEIKYKTDDRGRLYIKKCGWVQELPEKNKVAKMAEHKR